MEKWNALVMADRKTDSYLRREYQRDVLYAYYRFREVNLTFSKKAGIPTKAADGLAERLRKEGLVTGAQLADYLERVSQAFTPIDCCDDWSMEAIYSRIHEIRRACFGAPALERLRRLLARESEPLDFSGCIDQENQLKALLQRSCGVLLVLTQPELFGQLKRDLRLLEGKKLFAAVSSGEGHILPTEAFWREQLADKKITCLTDGENLPEETALLFYGEEGLLLCRSLKQDAVVTAVPRGYHAQALVNQLGMRRPCRVYVPHGLDITPWVRLTEKTRLTYWHLARLAQRYGDGIYEEKPQALYRRFPGFFLNIYENGPACPELPIPMTFSGEAFSDYDALRDGAVKTYLDGFRNVEYFCTYFDEHLRQAPISYDASCKQPGILVQGVRVKQAKGARVVRCPKGVTPRQMFRELDLQETGIVSNFLFFMTPKLGVLYNDLRGDRPLEQADAASGHLDYMLCYRDGKRVETFPLFRKTCLAMDEDGKFLFFNFRLGGGSIRVNGHSFEWSEDRVDREDAAAAVTVYTPYYSCPDHEADRLTYRKAVGGGRVNLIVLQDRITCIRRGDVILPSAGVVISLRQDMAEALLDALKPMEEGYYDVSGLELVTKLEPPEEIPPERWEKVVWAYGGGLSLILDGKAICDGDMDRWFHREGWMSPLSRQTQESGLHTIAKHPRTAIGTAENGDLVILVFSGRTMRSTGADYIEMCRIARALVPDIRSLMNADGGGSAMLGMTVNGSFLELSCPSTSADSSVGMVRPVNTVFYIPAGEREERQ